MKLYKFVNKYKYVIILILCMLIILFVFFNNNKELFSVSTDVNNKETILVLLHHAIGDNIIYSSAINYLTEKYNVELYSTNTRNTIDQVKYLYEDNKNVTIKYIPELDKKFILNKDEIDKYSHGIKKILKGGDYINKVCRGLGNCYLEQYDHIGVPRNILKTYFNIRTTDKSKEIYNKIKNDKYIFYEEKGSSGIVFNIEDALKKLKLNKDKYICISPNKNLYDKNHKHFNTANQYLFKENDINLIDYKTLIENANYNILSDTSIHALALFLDTKYDNNYYLSRHNRHENFKGFIEFMDKKHSFKYLYLN